MPSSLPLAVFTTLMTAIYPGALPNTGRGSRRRIDFGLCNGHFWATDILHFPGVGDHTGVCYVLEGFDLFAGLCRPRRRPMAKLTAAEVLEGFRDEEFEAAFAKAEQEDDVDHMWQILSTFAEDSLCDSQDGQPRHEHWHPCRRDRDVHKASAVSESLSLRRLRRLDRRIRHCCRAWSAPLQAQIRRDLSLRDEFPCFREVDIRSPLYMAPPSLVTLWRPRQTRKRGCGLPAGDLA